LREFAVRVLATDIRLHGRRFVTVEFRIAAGASIGLAIAVGIAAIVRGTGAVASAAAVVFFVGVAVNSVAVVRWVAMYAGDPAPERASLGDLGMFCAATLLPGALASALRSPE